MNEVIDLLNQSRLSALGVELKSGGVHGAVMHYSFDSRNLELFFSTDSRSRKVREVAAKSRASIVVGWSEQDWRTIQAEGDLCRVSPHDGLSEIQRRHYERHPNSAVYRDDPNTVFLRLTLLLVKFSDLGGLSPIISEYRRDGQEWRSV